MPIIKLAAALALIPLGASAAQVSTVQSFDGAGNLEDLFIDNFLPTFDGSLGTLTGVTIGVDATLSWDQFIPIGQPDDATSTYALFQNVGLSGTEILTEIDVTPQQFWTVTGPAFEFDNTFTVSGLVSDDPALFLDPANPVDLLVSPIGLVSQGSCTGFCEFADASDPEGEASGTLTTTFTFTPAPVPEPWSVALLGAGLIGIAAMRRRA